MGGKRHLDSGAGATLANTVRLHFKKKKKEEEKKEKEIERRRRRRGGSKEEENSFPWEISINQIDGQQPAVFSIR